MDNPTYAEFIDSTEIYCADYDFEPVNAPVEKIAWTHNEKWFMSGLAVDDVKELVCLN